MSRYAPSEDSYSRYAPSSPVSYAGDDGQSTDASVKPMRLKVLYTTDDKTNCMARWPKVLNVRTAFLDEKTEIGVVELRTCIQAIVTSSPELVAKLGHDYTVYAYDYSEFETPLVGQGMLSWVLASPANQGPSGGSTMVTGRVTRNANALFGRDNISQILEVKLRLMPVPTILQSDYIESMKRYREISRVMPESFDPQGWSDFLKDNPQVISMAATNSASGPNSPVNVVGGQMGLENVQRLMHQSNGPYQPPRPQQRQYAHSHGHPHSRRESFAESTLSRDASPTPSVQSAFPDAGRPHSQVMHRGELRRTASTGQMPGSDFDPNENDDAFDEGPSRKRARITQVKRPGRNAGFGKSVDSLRVAASTAASVRVFQPTAIRPGMERAGSLEEPPRAPTPVPQAFARGLRRSASTQQSKSSLGRFATAAPSSDAAGSYLDSARHQPRYSPEAGSVLESSPGEDPGSSPPDPRGHNFPAAPSSPQLPRMPMPVHQDSGFMSGTVEDETAQSDQVAIKPDPDTHSEMQQTMTDADKRPRPRKIAAKLTKADSVASMMTEEERAAEKSRKNALRAIGRLRTSSFTEGQAQPSSDPATATGSKRSRATSSTTDEPRSRHAYDKEKQKQRMDNRLQNAIAEGRTPAMCMNCGTIDTHTWRKAYKKTYSGSPSNVRTGKGPGAIVTVLIDERNEAGEVTLFSIIKKSLLGDDEGFQDILLCNPCGLWLRSKGEMRPPRVWQSSHIRSVPNTTTQSGADRPPMRSYDSGLRSAMPLPSEMTEPPSEAVLPPFQSNFDDEEGDQQDVPALDQEASDSQEPDNEPDNEPELPTLPESRRTATGTAVNRNNNKSRSDSEMPATSLAALQRAIQSSPGQLRGASRHSPIELDKTPDQTARRTLFPSPKARGPLGVTSGNKRSSLEDSPDAPKQTKYNMGPPAVTVIKVTTKTAAAAAAANKENAMLPPPAPTKAAAGADEGDERPTTPNASQHEDADYFSDLFKDTTATPSTPSRNGNITLPLPKSPSNLFRTPTRGTPNKNGATLGNFFSSAEKAYLHGGAGPNPSTPTRRTPGGMSSNGGNSSSSGNDTPFTRQLKNIFSVDANGAVVPSATEFELETSPSKVFANMPMLGDDFGTDWPMTTDMPMPSSPPVISRGHGGAGAGVASNNYLLKTPDGKGSLEKERCEGDGEEQGHGHGQEDDSPTWDELGLGKTPGMAPGVDEAGDLQVV